MVSFCSGKCDVDAVVTRSFASILMCIGEGSPLTSIQRPLKIWHVPKHFMKLHSSDTVVDSVVLFIFCDSQSTSEPLNALKDSWVRL